MHVLPESESAPSQSASMMRTAWLVVALLWPVAMLNYLDRQMMAAMKTSMMGDISDIATEANWGALLATFKWVYAVFSPLGGYLADKLSRRRTVAASLAVWSIVTWATGHCHTYHQLLIARGLMGISEAFYIPAGLALIADFHLGPTRSRAVGFHQMGIYVGIIVGGFSGYAADNPSIGWRGAFSAAGVVGVLYSIPLFFLLKNPPRVAGPEVPKTPLLQGFWELLTNASFLFMIAYFTLPGLAGWVVRDWMPSILKSRFDITQGRAGVSATLYISIASIVGAVVGGWLADKWMNRNQRGRVYTGAIGVLMIIPAMFALGHAGSLGVAIALLMLFGFGWGFFDGNNMPILCQIVRPELRATGYGILNFVGISCGGFADHAFGMLRDSKVPLNVSFAIFSAMCVVAGVFGLLIRPRKLDG